MVLEVMVRGELCGLELEYMGRRSQDLYWDGLVLGV